MAQYRAAQPERWLVCSKIFGQDIYSPGMEDKLPDGFPMTGPHWSDYEEPEPELHGVAAENAAQRRAMLEVDGEDEENDVDDTTAVTDEAFVRENDTTRLPKATRKKTATKAVKKKTKK
jgi:hypothetical protein